MQQLHLVGITTELDGLIFSTRRGARSGSFVVPIDAELLETLSQADRRRREAAPADSAEALPSGVSARRLRTSIRPESRLTPREMQARLRAGHSIAQVARVAGVEEDWVEGFAAPILAEHARTLDTALAMKAVKARVGESALSLAESVRVNLHDKGVPLMPTPEGWSVQTLGEGCWLIKFEYVSRRRRQVAEWELDVPNHELLARNRVASDVGYVASARRRVPPPPPPPPPPAAERSGPAEQPARSVPWLSDPRPRSVGVVPEAAPKKAVTKNAAPKKAPARKPAVRKAPARKAPGRKTATTKSPARRSSTRKAATTRRAAPRRATARKATARKATARKAAPRKTAARRPAARKTAARRQTARKATKKRRPGLPPEERLTETTVLAPAIHLDVPLEERVAHEPVAPDDAQVEETRQRVEETPRPVAETEQELQPIGEADRAAAYALDEPTRPVVIRAFRADDDELPEDSAQFPEEGAGSPEPASEPGAPDAHSPRRPVGPDGDDSMPPPVFPRPAQGLGRLRRLSRPLRAR
ncbi:MAG TPA: septation protein SepH [Acidimicrobiales bacterium]|nr:septation protein SepH [Acidimicrobiales bacterium]